MTARIVVLGALAVLAGCSSGDGTKKFAENGVSLRYPESWYVSGLSTTNSPRRVAVASFALPEDAVEGDCGGYKAVTLLPPDGALVLVIDYGWAASFAGRPDSLELEDGEYAEYECFGASTMFRFRVGDRDIQAHVALGSEADDRTRDRALAVLESLAVEEPEPFVPETRREGDRLVMPAGDDRRAARGMGSELRRSRDGRRLARPRGHRPAPASASGRTRGTAADVPHGGSRASRERSPRRR